MLFDDRQVAKSRSTLSAIRRRSVNTDKIGDVRDALAAAQMLTCTLHVEKVPADGGVEAGFAALREQRIGALFVAPQADFRMWIQQLVLLAARYALPTSFSSSDYVIAGGLMSYGPNQMDSYREAAVYTGRVLKGERPAELPVLVATKYDFMINLKTAKALDITISPSMLALATGVIE